MSHKHTLRNGIYSIAVIIAVCLIAFFLSNPVILQLSYGRMQNLSDPTSDAMDLDYLSSIPYEILRQVCASASSDPNLRVPLDGLSRSNKRLRDVSLPQLFRNVVIRGRWEFASSRLDAMVECHPMLQFVKYPIFVSLLATTGS